jgi:DNA-binding MarR family transcriptional regulator
MSRERVLDLADEFFQLARDRVPVDFLRPDLTMRQLKLLYTLYIDGPQTCGALASDQELSLSTMTGILARLERRGRHRRDSRRVISTLSRRGRELVDRLWASGRDALADVLADVPPDDLDTVERAMEILVGALRPPSASPSPVGALADDE